MHRVDRLLLKVQQAERLDNLQLAVAFIEPKGGKWEACAQLWNGKDHDKGGLTEYVKILCDTQEEALAAVDEVEKAHAPTGNRAKLFNSVCIIDDIME